MVAFKLAHGHLLVPSDFVVPRGDAHWPLGTVGLPLGRRARQIRNRNDYLGADQARYAQLDELGFVWDPRRYRRNLLHEAAERYAALSGGGGGGGGGGASKESKASDVLTTIKDRLPEVSGAEAEA